MLSPQTRSFVLLGKSFPGLKCLLKHESNLLISTSMGYGLVFQASWPFVSVVPHGKSHCLQADCLHVAIRCCISSRFSSWGYTGKGLQDHRVQPLTHLPMPTKPCHLCCTIQHTPAGGNTSLISTWRPMGTMSLPPRSTAITSPCSVLLCKKEECF